MSNLFDAMHRAFFDQLFSLDKEGRAARENRCVMRGCPKQSSPNYAGLASSPA
jgi:hypothetical protein